MKIKDLADYCLKCKNPTCVNGCPVRNDIPNIINLISNEQFHDAYRELLKTQVIPELCGKLCAHDHQCEGKCIRGIKGEPVKIGEVEQLLGEMFKDSFLNDETYQKSIINDKNIVITLADGIYNAYLKRNDVGIKITAGKIEEKELENTIKSLLE